MKCISIERKDARITKSTRGIIRANDGGITEIILDGFFKEICHGHGIGLSSRRKRIARPAWRIALKRGKKCVARM